MLLILLFTAFLTTAFAFPTPFGFWPAGPGDARSPCPLLNSLANHNILPHNGKDISLAQIQTAFSKVNIGQDVADALGGAAISVLGDSGTIDLDALNAHNIFEHDGSLSRNDAFSGNDHSFNSAIYQQTSSYFTGSTIDIATGAKARFARMTASQTTNPTFNLTALGIQASLLETPFYLSLFGDPATGNAKTSWVNIFFQQERLPYFEGWTPRAAEMNMTTLGVMAGKVVAATPTSITLPVSPKKFDFFDFFLSFFHVKLS